MNRPVHYWIEALKDESFVLRVTAARALAGAGPEETVQAAAALSAALRDRETGVREAAAEALGALGPAAHSALRALLKCLADENPFVRATAAASLEKIDPQPIPLSSAG
jgi:HEAT repeat protein